MLLRAFGALAVAVLAGIIAWVHRQTRLDVIRETRALSALSGVALADHRPGDAVKLGLASWPRDPNRERPRLESSPIAISGALSQERLPLRKLAHDEPLRGALLTRDERHILSWSEDNTLRLWDAATGQPVGPAMRHDGPVSGALLTRDERRILSWSEDATLRLWDAAWPKGNVLELACALLSDRDL